eukprot:COSAG01_NODE_1568_length_9874_cov_15.549872_10_plen_91_part_00
MVYVNKSRWRSQEAQQQQEADEKKRCSASAIHSPWVARALRSYPQPVADDGGGGSGGGSGLGGGAQAHPSDLVFGLGDLILVTSKHCDTW